MDYFESVLVKRDEQSVSCNASTAPSQAETGEESRGTPRATSLGIHRVYHPFEFDEFSHEFLERRLRFEEHLRHRRIVTAQFRLAPRGWNDTQRPWHGRVV